MQTYTTPQINKIDMCNNHKLLPKGKRIALLIPNTVLSNQSLSLNEKLILGIDYSFQKKLGYNSMPNIEMGRLLNLHPNIVSKARNKLVKQKYLKKEKRKYLLNNIDFCVDKEDFRDLIIPFWIYSSTLSTGAKLLWSEYNSFNNNGKSYYASRKFTAKKLGCSIESITNWTKELLRNGFLKSYELKSGYCTKQKSILTCKFSKEGKIID